MEAMQRFSSFGPFLICGAGFFLAIWSSSALAAPCEVVRPGAEATAIFQTELNNTRRAKRLEPVATDSDLRLAAVDYACEMALSGRFDHVAADGSDVGDRAKRASYDFCMLGENIANGQRRLDEVFAAWLNSSGHYANYIMDGARDYAVAGAMQTSDAGSESDAAASELASLARRHGGRVIGSETGTIYSSEGVGRIYWVMLIGSREC